MASLALTILNQITTDLIQDFLLGRLDLCGGVLRWAAGTDREGQIAAILEPANMLGIAHDLATMDWLGLAERFLENRQTAGILTRLGSLEATSKQILGLARQSMFLSGLNLAVSAAGFAFLGSKLNAMERYLQKLGAEVQELRELFELRGRAELKAALSDLTRVLEFPPKERLTMLNQARFTLASSAHQYEERLKEAETAELALSFLEYYLIAALAHARCYAILGNTDLAHRDFGQTLQTWNEQARRIARELLIGKHPERFLYSDYAPKVPLGALVEWLDYANGTNKGLTWVEELRRALPAWHQRRGIHVSLPKVVLHDRMSAERELQFTVSALELLVSRSCVLEGYLAQYQFLGEHGISLTDYEESLARFRESTSVEQEYLVVVP
jgi:tetratricopeptide (TPR) repeat protein